MKFKGIIRNVGEAVTGTSKTTGREWQKRELVIAVAHPKEQPTPNPSQREGLAKRLGLKVLPLGKDLGWAVGLKVLPFGKDLGWALGKDLGWALKT